MIVLVINSMQLEDFELNIFYKMNFIMSFFIFYKYQEDVFVLFEEDVYLLVVQFFCVYVKVYGGFLNIRKVKENYDVLVRLLKRDEFDGDIFIDMFYIVGYNSLMELFNCYNEIWIVSKMYILNLNEEIEEDFEIGNLQILSVFQL